MKFFKNKIYGLLIAALVFAGCNEDSFLTEINPNANNVSLFFSSENDYNSALTTVYGALQFQAISGRNLISEFALGDEGGTTAFARLAIQFKQLTYNDADEAIVNKWNELYIGISRANQVIKSIEIEDDALFTRFDKNEIEAQARFLRAFFYFQLVHTYGGGVLRTDIIQNQEDLDKGFSSIQEITDAVITPDLEYAMANLPKKWEGDDIGRITWGAAASLLGKSYLYNKNWPMAADMLGRVVNDPDATYQLTADIADNFTHFNEFNSESILEVNYSFDLSPGVGGTNVDDTPGGPGAESSGLATTLGKQGNGGFNQVLTSYYINELMEADEVDETNPINDGNVKSKRMNSSIATRDGDGLWYLEDPAEITPAFNFAGISAYPKKHSNWYHLAAEPAQARSGINFRHIRFADVLLLYAEAILENSGDFTTAINLIDRVRARAGVVTLQQYMDDNAGQFPQLHISEQVTGAPRPLVTPSVETVMTHLRLVERPTELCYEGHRWKDLVRWGIVRQVFEDQRAQEIWRIDNFNQGAMIRGTAPLDLNIAPRIDYEDALRNYQSKIHDYWPIPNPERQTNDEL